jgi:hypothetical protein
MESRPSCEIGEKRTVTIENRKMPGRRPTSVLKGGIALTVGTASTGGRTLFGPLPDLQQVGLLLHFCSPSMETEVFDVRQTTVGFDDFAARLSKIRTGELLMVER